MSQQVQKNVFLSNHNAKQLYMQLFFCITAQWPQLIGNSVSDILEWGFP